MKANKYRVGVGILLLAAAAMPGCSPSTPAAAPAPIAPAIHQASNSITASVRVEPARSADLGFLISAPVRQVLVSEGEAVDAGQALIVLDAPQLELNVKAAEQGLVAARQNQFIQSQGRRKWDGFKFVWVAGPPEQRTVANARVLQAQASSDAARAELEQATLRAPFDGTVVSIHAWPDEVVQPDEIVATIGDLADLPRRDH